MRNTFVNTLLNKAVNNKNIILLTADLGFSVFEEYMKKIPKQYLNVGIAEQNMAGVAAGMAMEGKLPIIYSIVPFAVMRNFEQIRNDICYQNLNVKIVGVGAGFSYGPYGHTHHGLEDIGVLRTIPNLTILAPGDPIEVSLATEAALEYVGPVYIRLGKTGVPNVHKSTPLFEIGKGILIEDGDQLTIIATSTLLYQASEITEKLKKDGFSVRLISIPTIKPLDEEMILESGRKTKAIFTIEEHSIIGGLGSAVAELLMESGINLKFKRFGVKDHFTKEIGRQEYMRRVNNLSVDQIQEKIVHVFKNK